jgi:hypothetical protein
MQRPRPESTVTIHIHQTVPTQFVEAKGIRFAYRRFGKPDTVPLVFNQHFTQRSNSCRPEILQRCWRMAHSRDRQR